jgi:hypothetical protein
MHARALATDVVHEETETHTPLRGAVRAAGGAALRRMLVDTERTSLRLRSVPMPGENVIGKLARHSTVEAIGPRVDGYAEVRDARGKVGWASLRYLRPERAEVAPVPEPEPLPGDMHRQQTISGDPFVKGEGDADEVDPKDVKQGAIGDCYFMASAAAVARANPALIRKLITKLDAHTYEVTLYPKDRSEGDNAPTKVVVTDQFPIDEDGMPAYGRSPDGNANGPELWVMLLEKAYATQEGAYDVIGRGGPGASGLNLLLAGGATSHRVSDYTADQLGALFEEAHRPIVTNTGSDSGFFNALRKNHPWLPDWLSNPRVLGETEVGAYALHEYAIKSVNMKARWLEIQNPWGHDDVNLSFDEYRQVFVEFAVGNR